MTYLNTRADLCTQEPIRRNSPVSAMIVAAAARRMPKMHWRWCRRGRDIVAFLEVRFGRTLPHDDAGMDAVRLLAQHYLQLNIDPERVTRANLRLMAPWLTETETVDVIRTARKATTPSAAVLGRQWRVTTDEITAHGLTTITAYTVTQDGDRNRQARRRRKAGAGLKRGRPSMGLSAEERKARQNAQAAARMRAKRAKEALRKNDHASSYIGATKRDELSVTHSDRRSAAPQSAAAHETPAVIEVLETVEAELLPEIRITVSTAPEVIDLIPVPVANRRAQARRPFRSGLLEQFREQGMAMFGGTR